MEVLAGIQVGESGAERVGVSREDEKRERLDTGSTSFLKGGKLGTYSPLPPME